MKQMAIHDFFTKTIKKIDNERNHKRHCANDRPCVNEDSSNSLSNSEAVAIESVHSPPDNSRPSDNNNEILFPSQHVGVQEIDTLEDDGEVKDYMDLESSLECAEVSDISLECDVSPDILNYIRRSSPTSSIDLGIPSKKKKRGVRKLSKAEASNSISLILHTIDQYDKHLKTSNALQGILTDESLALLSDRALEPEDNKKLLSYLYCVDQYEPESIADEDIPLQTLEIKQINNTRTLLYEKEFITFFPKDSDTWTSEQCMERLTSSQMQAVCETFKLKIPFKKKKSYKDMIRTLMTIPDIRMFSKDSTITVDRRTEVLKELRSKVKKWKLSDLARETINELIVFMHLDTVFKLGCSIDFTKEYNDRPGIKFKPSGSTKTYPLDKKMIVDNATIIFQDRKEFCTYLEALAYFAEYKTVSDKRDIVLRIYQLYKDVTKENMSRYTAMPLWLHIFTPVKIYVDILEDGVTHLKKEEYDKKLEILDLLIAQVAFKQDKKAKWYDMKFNIQRNSLRSIQKAAATLCEAFNADLPEETLMTLRNRAKKITDIKTRGIDQKVLDALLTNAKRGILECNIPEPHNHFQAPAQKSNSRCRPQYEWKGELVSAETLCCNIHKKEGPFTVAEHWEGTLMTTIYFLLFWDIIYTKPLAIGGIFMSHYQQYPLDMWYESFYINRKAIIDGFLIKLENSTVDDVMEMIKTRYDELVQYNVPEMTRKDNNYDNITTVVRCLGPRPLAAICRRLARNYTYMRYGFPDLTLCNTDNQTIEFREVKTDKDIVRSNQIQWLRYLNEHNIKAGFCYLSNKKEQDTSQKATNEQHIDSSHSPDTNNIEDPQPGPITSSV